MRPKKRNPTKNKMILEEEISEDKILEDDFNS
jgi:hypothetical protein